MGSARRIRLLALAALALVLAPQPVWALLNVDGTRNQIFVFGELQLGYDSNLFAQPNAEGDVTTTATAGVELKRRAGVIAVDAKAALSYQSYRKFSAENSWNPSLYLTLTKTTGRTTGSLSVSAYRSSRADSAVNLLTSSWNVPVGLSVKYPLNEKLAVSSNTGYLNRSFLNNPSLTHYIEYSEGVDLYYTYTSKLDLFAGYRVRYATTARGRDTDHNFSVGASGALLAKLEGLVRVGYQVRNDRTTGDHYNQVSAAAQLAWTINRNTSLTAEASSDYGVSAIGATVDTVASQLRGTYVFTRRFQAEAGIGFGRNRYLTGNQPGRLDHFFSWDAGATYTFNDHLKVSGTYFFIRNSSNLATSEFTRDGVSLDISSRF